MIIKKDGECAERQGKWEHKRAIERDFCLNRCPHPKASECRWAPKECMAEAARRGVAV